MWRSYVKHFMFVCLFLAILLFLEFSAGGLRWNAANAINFDPWEKYGKAGTFYLYLIRALCLLPLPLTVCNIIGLLRYNTFRDRPTLNASPMLAPFLCIRTVTRGDYVNLVRRGVERNLKTCSELGVENFILEIVTDKKLDLKKDAHVREIVVPKQYQTKRGTLYKARALQYCLEPDVNMLQNNDWIVHLDEETLLTRDSLIGILNFVTDGKYSFGQGVITYANEEIVSWFTTIADSVRVGMDFGIIRFTLQSLHRPYFSIKGSYVVSNAGAELALTFDNGPDGSIAEDCYLAMAALRDGYKFGFIEGEMWEKSTFSIKDFTRQRARWVQGIYKVWKCPELPWRAKWGLSFMVLAWITMPFTTSNIFFSAMYPVPTPQWIDFIMGFVGAVYLLMYTVGAMKSFNRHRLGLCRYLMLLAAPVAIMPASVLLETFAVVHALYLGANKNTFYVVLKETHRMITPNTV